VQHTINGRPLKSAFRVQVDSHQVIPVNIKSARKKIKTIIQKRGSFQIYISVSQRLQQEKSFGPESTSSTVQPQIHLNQKYRQPNLLFGPVDCSMLWVNCVVFPIRSTIIVRAATSVPDPKCGN
jgi:hypothetical protein